MDLILHVCEESNKKTKEDEFFLNVGAVRDDILMHGFE